MQLDVIIGVSFFNNKIALVGVALRGEHNGINLCTVAAQSATTPWSRPATVEPIGNRPQADQIAYLVGRWQEWATKNNISLTINTTPRAVSAF